MAALPWAALNAQTPPAASPPAQPDRASQSPPELDTGGEEDVESIVVQGQRPPGSVIGDIQPEVTLSPADVRSYGVSNVADLLNELSAQTGQATNGPPVVLLNGKRISGMSEIRNIPTEAILRTEILPEEVALEYGYNPDQKVVNIVLRRRFRAVTGELEGAATTDGGGARGEGDADLFHVRGDTRLNLDVEYTRNAGLLESQRDVTSRAVGRPYDFAGNVTSPDGRSELDPGLSALAGTPVTIAGVPAGAAAGAPALGDFVGGAGVANVSDVSPYRSLSPRSDALSINAVLAHPIGNVSATLNGTFDATGSRSLRGLPGAGLTLPAGNPFSPFSDDVMLYRYPMGIDPLTQRTSGETGHIGTTLNGQISSRWRWTFTGTYDRAASRTSTERGIDVSAIQAALDANDPALNPFAALPAGMIRTTAPDRARSLSNAGDVELMINGQLWRLPAGPITTTVRVGGTVTGFDSTSTRAGLASSASLSRSQGEARIHFDLPILKRESPIGAFTANVNAGVVPVSGFGTLDMHGYGFNWRPRTGLSVILSVTDTGSAPSIQQLGNPQVLTPGVRVFDYRTGTTVEVTRLDGGNPDLEAGNRNVFRLGLNWKPIQNTDLTIVANYQRIVTRDTASSLPAPTAAIEAAFPQRFVRDEDGALIRIDNTPINFDRETRTQLRWGFNFSHRLRSDTQKLIAAYRAAGIAPPGRRQFPGAAGGQRPRGEDGAPAQGQQQQQAQAQGDQAPVSRPAGDGAPGAPGAGGGFGAGPGGGGRPGGGFGGGRGGFGGGQGAQGGRLQFALYHTWVFRDDIRIQPGMPELDLLGGDALGSSGGIARHKLEGQAGYSNNGLGFRLTANWQSATSVRGGAGSVGNLDFSDLTTLNARLFADLGQIPSLVKHRWARGMRLTLSVDNIFNQRQDVRDEAGNTPLAYQPAYLDPMGRTVRLTIRKLFF
ncbi:TonB-dependent receptor [Sphingomonas sp. XMGL2]|uniref:TonB-dependent receptor n=2 Tax=Sphingomonas quercus TaxID=2842451 RepID=A0ABS6BMF3_9SPHN|nr:TonB-dependent receptor [Sphingomonas quercus]